MKTRSNLNAVERRQANHKGCDEKRPGAFEHTRPFVSVACHSPLSKDRQPCTA